MKRRGRYVSPIAPATFKGSDALRWTFHLVRKPDLGRERSLYPLLKIAGVICTNVFPELLVFHFRDPGSFSWPPPWSDKDKRDICPFCALYRSDAFFKIIVCLVLNVRVDPELPPRCARRYPRCAGAGLNKAIPAGTFGIVIARKIHFLKIVSRGVNERS